MARVDLSRLRKERGLSQIDLARKLKITQSYLSAIENGRGQLNAEKEALLKRVMGLESLDNYYVKDHPIRESRLTDDLEESNLLERLLKKFHDQAHKEDPNSNHHHEHHRRIEYLEAALQKLLDRNEILFARNEQLEQKLEEQQNELDSSRKEIYRLRLLLTKLGADADTE